MTTFCGSERSGGATSGITVTSSDDEAVPPGAAMVTPTMLVAGRNTLPNLQVMLLPSVNGMALFTPHVGMKNVMPPTPECDSVKV